LQPNDDGSVDFVRLQVRDGKVTGRNAINWSKGAFSTKISQLKEVAKELQSMNENLRAVKITIPTGDLSWMTDDPFTANFTRRVPSGALWNQSTDPAPDVPKK
jgi:hypothetical protein